ncbi:MAG: 3-deoxy-7-phosphoheptulonate synthase [Gammaproteobacteria bacterium]|nr:3-deoxy-7-phosphoheptulonate synthase [Gammaproteobacteria bacterium]
MRYETDDLRINGMDEALAPESLIDQFPVSPESSKLVFEKRKEAADIVHGDDQRLLCIVGPCSIHDTISALEYADRLAHAAETYNDQLCILMRVYFEKPRTTVGWKGLINDPHLNGSFEINDGLRTARQLLCDIAGKKLGTGTEYLDPITPQFVGDLVSWSAIGARTTESQIHRQLASGLSCPVGFKNSTKGDVQIAADAVKSAINSHIFLSVTKSGQTAIFSTTGNPDCHIILRGGGGQTNYDADSIGDAVARLEKADVTPRLMVDMSHANSQKDHKRQMHVCDEICEQIPDPDSAIMGVMIESHLVEGNQKIGDGTQLTYGQSITDACIGWEDTELCLEQLANAVEKRFNGH